MKPAKRPYRLTILIHIWNKGYSITQICSNYPISISATLKKINITRIKLQKIQNLKNKALTIN
ncbi:hypothetical protein MXB_2176 [Myxobolus squamalis]|nr:hypothetical protein MXB_2176 [Myxobolus squamalis]